MKHQKVVTRKLLSGLLCLALLTQLWAGAWAAEVVIPEGMLSGGESSSVESSQKAESADADAPQPEKQVPEEPKPEEAEEDNQSSDVVQVGPDQPEFWESFHEEYAEDGDYVKRYELYQEEGVKRAFEIDDELGNINMLSEEELEAYATGSSTTKSPFTGKTYTHASSQSGKKVVLGIDVSKHQGSIDWVKVKAAGVKFAILRCGYTNLSKWKMNRDEMFDTYITPAYNAGIQIGIYYFSQATTVKEAETEANKVLEIINPYKSMITLPVAMDYERVAGGRINKISRANGTKIIKKFLETIAAGGYSAYIYANTYDLTTFSDVSQISQYGYWMAWYQNNDGKSKPTAPTYSGTYDFWQYSAQGSVKGISGRVDCNFWYQGNGTSTEPEQQSGDTTTPSAPTGLSVTETGETSVALKWTAVSTAQSYIVEGKESGGSYVSLATPVGNTCKVTELKAGTEYTFRVKAVNAKGTGNASATVSTTTTAPKRTDLPAPEVVSAESVNGGVKVKWNAVSEADLYRVYHKTKDGKWTKVCDTAKLECLDADVSSGTWYRYTVRCLNASDKSFASTYDSTGKSLTYLAAPALSKASYSGSAVQLSWGKVPGAKTYRVFRKGAGTGWKRIGDTTKTSLQDKKVKDGDSFTYTVRCVSRDGKTYLSGFDSKGLSVYCLSAPKLSSVKGAKKGKFTCSWGKITGAQGYQVRWMLGKDSKSKDAKAKTSATVTRLKKGRTYTVSVRAYRTVNGQKVYSLWSSTKKVKLPK